jgi:hypothetical protein
MVVVNACIKTLTAFSHGEPPAAWANAADAKISENETRGNARRSQPLMAGQRETNLFRRIFFIAGEFLSDDAKQARIGIRRQALASLAGRNGRMRSRRMNLRQAAAKPLQVLRVRPIAFSGVARISKFQ